MPCLTDGRVSRLVVQRGKYLGRGDQDIAWAPDFQLNGWALCQRLRLEGFGELPIAAEHALAVRELPLIHRGSFPPMSFDAGSAE